MSFCRLWLLLSEREAICASKVYKIGVTASRHDVSEEVYSGRNFIRPSYAKISGKTEIILST